MVQHAPDATEGYLMLERMLGADDLIALARIIQASPEHLFRFDLRYGVETIPRSPGGKFEEFIRTCD